MKCLLAFAFIRVILFIRDSDYTELVTQASQQNRPLVLKHGDIFAVFSAIGQMTAKGGVFSQDTRHLSDWVVAVPGYELQCARVEICQGSLQIDQTADGLGLKRVIRLSALGFEEVCSVENQTSRNLDISFRLEYAADFADLFEVRGIKRSRQGIMQAPDIGTDYLKLAYLGLDGQLRSTTLNVDTRPVMISETATEFRLQLAPGQTISLKFQLRFLPQSATQQPVNPLPELTTGKPVLDAWLGQSRADLGLLLTQTPEGLYPYAGIPWYSTVFGRDGLLTALFCLEQAPDISRGVLNLLAVTQAQSHEPDRDAEPGKILHERRSGEMAALNEIPYGRYYGSVDATPLFLILSGAYFARTQDLSFIQTLWPSIRSALDWLEHDGDRDGDGFVEYFKLAPGGLVHQGWKDSRDAVMHADGTPASGPIALCEVQAYVFAARLAVSEIATALGYPELARDQQTQAEQLRERFEAQFWCEELGTYGLALDGDKNLCRVLSSNAGHCLFAGIASPERAMSTAQSLLAEQMFSGWGIRTLSTQALRYDPKSYHNGSIWPHDNAIIAAGFARYGLQAEARQVYQALQDLSQAFAGRLTELICGYARKPEKAPVLYPIACSPQAWAAGSVYLLLEAAGITYTVRTPL